MNSGDGIDVSDELDVDKDVRLSLDVVQAVVQAVVGTVEVIILNELPHDSDIQTINLAIFHMEFTSGIVFDDAVRINEEPDLLQKEVGRPGSLVNLPNLLEIALGSVPSEKTIVSSYPVLEFIKATN